MARHECSVLIDRPVDEVFAYVMDPVHNARWQTGVIETHWGGGLMQAGERVTETREFAGHRLEVTIEVLELEEPRRSRVRVDCGKLPGTAGYRFEAIGDRTRFTVEVEVAPRGPLRFAARMFGCVAMAEVSSSCQRLKETLEDVVVAA